MGHSAGAILADSLPTELSGKPDWWIKQHVNIGKSLTIFKSITKTDHTFQLNFKQTTDFTLIPIILCSSTDCISISLES